MPGWTVTKIIQVLAAAALTLALFEIDVAAAEPRTSGTPTDRMDKFGKLGSLLTEVGLEATALVGGDPDGLFLYAEMDDARLSVFLFRNEGKAVRWYLDSFELTERIQRVWSSAEAKERWAVMIYEVQGGKFDVSLSFPEEVDFTSEQPERVFNALWKRFPGRKVVRDKALDNFLRDHKRHFAR